VRAVRRVAPREVEDRPVTLPLRVLQPRADLLAEVVVEPELGPAVIPGVDRLEVPLEQALGVRERAVLLDVSRRREQEHLGSDLIGLELTGLDLGAVVPEGGGLDLDEVANDEPVELREREALRTAVRGADGRVLAE